MLALALAVGCGDASGFGDAASVLTPDEAEQHRLNYCMNMIECNLGSGQLEICEANLCGMIATRAMESQACEDALTIHSGCLGDLPCERFVDRFLDTEACTREGAAIQAVCPPVVADAVEVD